MWLQPSVAPIPCGFNPHLLVVQAAAGLWTFVNDQKAWEGPYTVAELRQLVKQ